MTVRPTDCCRAIDSRMMQLGELLTEEHIQIPLDIGSIAEGLLRLLPPEVTAGWDVRDGESLLRRLQGGEGGVARRASARTVVLSLRGGETDPPWAALGVASGPISGLDQDSGDEEGPRALLVLRLPPVPEFGTGATEGLVRALQDPVVQSDLLRAASPAEVMAIGSLMELDLAEPLRVEHVLTPLKYRVFPDTPLDEVVELMARRELRSLPVVGEDMQVLGMVTAGEALRYALEQTGRGKAQDERSSKATARDAMNRTVMCVSEDQELVDAAQVMANRDVGQLPVVREGEIVGVLTRDAVLKAVFGVR